MYLELPQALLNQDDWLNWDCCLGCGAGSFEGVYQGVFSRLIDSAARKLAAVRGGNP